jgi:tetratricopeptide (TPR) repeat protein
LSLLYGFNHEAAIASFTYAAELSPDCAMCFWGISYAHGPHINNPQVPPESGKAAFRALQQAQARAPKATEVEQALITALGRRYAEPQPEDRTPLDVAYAAAMRGVRDAYPKDADVVALTAEALMNLHPWDYYAADGTAKSWTPEILEVTQAALALAPKHPMANHIWIHAVEASSDPGRALGAADLLRDLQPGLGHMVHMPSHIDVRTGQWAKDQLPQAREEQKMFEAARTKVPTDRVMGQNPVAMLNEIASHLLAGEILYREKKEAAAFDELRKAVEAEDRLRYNEPPDWVQPTRHALGAALTRSKKYKEAEAVFREDLRRVPGNGWALFGLARALRMQGKHAEAERFDQQFKAVWSKADVQLESACMCQAGR